VRAERLNDIAQALVDAETSAQQVAPFGDGMTVEDAYAVQARVEALKAAAGVMVIGWKTAFTNPAVAQQVGAREPIAGRIYSTAPLAGEVDASKLPEIYVEPEVTFRLARDLRGPGVTVSKVLAATEGVCASFEVASTRVAGAMLPRVRPVDIAADNAAGAHIVMSSRWLSLGECGDISKLSVELEHNGAVTHRGDTSSVLGNPARAVAWLANKLAELGLHLRAGQIILSGSVLPFTVARRGDRFVARFENLGEVELLVV
jgi:2-keto-4-pentenoate hydratase